MVLNWGRMRLKLHLCDVGSQFDNVPQVWLGYTVNLGRISLSHGQDRNTLRRMAGLTG